MTMYNHIRHSIFMLIINKKMMYVASTHICETLTQSISGQIHSDSHDISASKIQLRIHLRVPVTIIF